MSPQFLRRASDEALGGRLASGEAAAFDELYRRYVHRLAAYGAHLLGDGAAGEDVAQASLLKAYGALRAGRVPDAVRPWLYRIAHNVAIDLVARRRELPSAELPDSGREDAAGRGALVAALGSLPDRQRRVYVLREIHGLRIDETAAELGLTVPQVEQGLFAARNRLAELLVFGERLSCVAVQRLAQGPLDGDERRGLKTHLRSCPGCRRAVGRRTASLALLPLPSLDWLRGLAGLGGAPAAAKVGVAVATATVAAGVPLTLTRGAPAPIARADRSVHLAQVVASVRPVAGRPVAAPAFGTRLAAAAAAVAVFRRGSTSGGAGAERRDDAATERRDGGERSGSGEDNGGRDASPARGSEGEATRSAEAEPARSDREGRGGDVPATVPTGGTSGERVSSTETESSGSGGGTSVNAVSAAVDSGSSERTASTSDSSADGVPSVTVDGSSGGD